VAFALGSYDASWRAPQRTTLAGEARSAPWCSIDGRVQERAGGLGTLIAIARADCSGFRPIVRAGLVDIQRDVGDAGTPVALHGALLALTNDPFDRAIEHLGAAARVEPLDVSSGSIPKGPFAVAARVREGLDGAVADMDRRPAALIEGVTIGDTSGFDRATLDEFRRAGLSHLLAVSGENVAMVLGAIALLSGRLRYVLRLLIAGTSLGLFVLIVGPQPSVLRAAVMAGIALFAVATGRRSDPLVVLGLALIVVVALRPGLVFAAGLQLSAGATLGIILWCGRLTRRMSFLPRPLALALSATLAAQFAVSPIIVAIFGQLSLIGPVANLLAFPAVAAPTVLGLAAGVVDIVAPGPGRALAAVAEPFARWILFVAHALGRPSWAAAALPPWSASVLALPVIASALWACLGYDKGGM
jgi:competence protein ComEC